MFVKTRWDCKPQGPSTSPPYDQALQELHARYPTSEALLASAIARTSGGE
jgi:hypothetical protein